LENKGVFPFFHIININERWKLFGFMVAFIQMPLH
jgi:hypothetical protein